mgnify:CR=1 FL=1
MSEKIITTKSERLMSLDVFRGMTIAGMVLVNNPGSWGHLYRPVGHAKWHGWTPTDLIFPFFLFIVGVAMTFSFDKRIAKGQSRLRLFEQVCRRTIILFLLGLILAGLPWGSFLDWSRWRLIFPYIGFIIGLGFLFADEPPLAPGKTKAAKIRKIIGGFFLIGSTAWFLVDLPYFQNYQTNERAGLLIRVPGVLQRIAICYFFTSIIIFFTGVKGRIAWALGLIVVYWLIVKLVHAPAGYDVPVTGREGLLHDWIDRLALGRHVYSERPDPEGILSTIPAIATTLAGVLCGNWLKTDNDKKEKCLGLFFMGIILTVTGIWLSYGFPINKKIWSSSYVVFTAGMALLFLGTCFYLIDIKQRKKWTYPFMVFGTNPIFIFVASAIFARVTYMIRVPHGEDIVTLKRWIFLNLQDLLEVPKAASLTFAVSYVIFWFLIMIPFYRKKIFIKI